LQNSLASSDRKRALHVSKQHGPSVPKTIDVRDQAVVEKGCTVWRPLGKFGNNRDKVQLKAKAPERLP
jgi:hypothetical protein